MIRKFYINMTQKGKFQFQYNSLIENGMVRFIKTDKKQVEIVEIDYTAIEELYKKEVEESTSKGFFQSKIVGVERILGINKNNPYRKILLAREIKDSNKDGYIEILVSDIEKETEKAYQICDRWIAKSQTMIENDRLYIKDWLFFKTFLYK